MEENIMQSIYEQCGGTYHENKNGHLIPDLSNAETEQLSIGVWGQRRKKYLKEYNRGLYDELLLSGKLYQHLSDIDSKYSNMSTTKRKNPPNRR
ncbi:MAG: TnpV protein, partial [Clostridiales bacterium]|nr:TnpV protein [Clostridiales bacterium]